MKKLKAHIEQYFDKLANQFRALSIQKQQRLTLYFFVGYLLLTTAIIWKVWQDIATSKEIINIKHIQNPALKLNESSTRLQDTLLIVK